MPMLSKLSQQSMTSLLRPRMPWCRSRSAWPTHSAPLWPLRTSKRRSGRNCCDEVMSLPRKYAKPRPCVLRVLAGLKSRVQRCRCCKTTYCALHTQSDDATGKTLPEIAHWRANWMVTPRALKRNALWLHLRSLRSHQSQPSGHVTKWAGKAVVSLHHPGTIRRYTFLGATYCKNAFEALTGVNVSRTRKLMNQGLQTIEETRNRKRTAGDQMSSAIWLMANELNDESPYARDRDKTVLHLPFH